MASPRLLDEIGSRLAELAASSPAKDLEKNVKALLASGFSRLDLVTREEFEVQGALLARAEERLAELERRVAELEAGQRGSAG
ncbi:MAG: accessory factor UbiK family protein [Rhodocyclaceae bacterium]|nr:accessory factor UbiK family protein [Rhodocyclaceae bacterium]